MKTSCEVEALEMQVLISRCLSCEDFNGAQALSELAARHNLRLNSRWIQKRWVNQLGLWQLRREAAEEPNS
jgi:hypothetical protein